VYELSAGALEQRTDFGVNALSVGGGRMAIVRQALGELVEHVEVAPLAGDDCQGRRIGAGGSPALAADGTLAWSPLTTRANGSLGHAVYVRKPGAHTRRVATYARVWMKQPAAIAWSPSGRTAYGTGCRSGNQIRLLSAAGEMQASFATDAFPLAWSSDERSLLVSSPRGLGLLDPMTGAITELGLLPCGVTVDAHWLAG
jgi:hypothetical protein